MNMTLVVACNQWLLVDYKLGYHPRVCVESRLCESLGITHFVSRSSLETCVCVERTRWTPFTYYKTNL